MVVAMWTKRSTRCKGTLAVYSPGVGHIHREADMRSTNPVPKLAALIVIVVITFWAYMPSDFWGGCVCSAAILVVGLLPFHKRVLLIGKGQTMGVLPALSSFLFLWPVGLFQLFPCWLDLTGFATSIQELNLNDTLVKFIIGAIMVGWIWVPLGCYRLIDYVIGKRAAKPAA
ncbi:MAG: hypothetical protein JWN49_212 [Parcubacteria group bacterium]|nr:hypothetical protein [Parcubacteria group bacterium]